VEHLRRDFDTLQRENDLLKQSQKNSQSPVSKIDNDQVEKLKAQNEKLKKVRSLFRIESYVD